MSSDIYSIDVPRVAHKPEKDDHPLLHVSPTAGELTGMWISAAVGPDLYDPAGADCGKRRHAEAVLDRHKNAPCTDTTGRLVAPSPYIAWWAAGPMAEPAKTPWLGTGRSR